MVDCEVIYKYGNLELGMDNREFDLIQKLGHLKCARHPDNNIAYLRIKKGDKGGASCFYCEKDEMSIDLGEL